MESEKERQYETVQVLGKERKIHEVHGEKRMKISFDIPTWMFEELTKRCEILDTDRSKIVRYLIEEFINQPLKKGDYLQRNKSFGMQALSEVDQELLQKRTMNYEIKSIKTDMKSMKEILSSIVDYIKKKELVEMHKDLHPRENP